MITVTTAALERLSRKLIGKQAAVDHALRFERGTGQWRLGVDQARPNDTTFTHGGKNVLLLDQATAEAMTAMTLAVTETASGPRLKLGRNANPAS